MKVVALTQAQWHKTCVRQNDNRCNLHVCTFEYDKRAKTACFGLLHHLFSPQPERERALFWTSSPLTLCPAGLDGRGSIAGSVSHPPPGAEIGGTQLRVDTRDLSLVLWYPDGSPDLEALVRPSPLPSKGLRWDWLQRGVGPLRRGVPGCKAGGCRGRRVMLQHLCRGEDCASGRLQASSCSAKLRSVHYMHFADLLWDR